MAKELNITARRLLKRMEETAWTQDTLADAIGVTQGTISQIITGKTHRSRHLPAIANKLAVNLNWLLGITDQKIDMFDQDGEQISEDTLAAIRAGIIDNRLQKPEQLSRDQPTDSLAEFGLVAVREIDLTLGMGATYLDVPVTETIRHFPIDWLRIYTKADPDQLLFAQSVGDSMEPTLRDSDLLLIDCSQQHLNMSDKVWAIAYADCGAVKRLRPVPGGGVEILSDNPNVPTATAYDGELHILGRVVATVRKM